MHIVALIIAAIVALTIPVLIFPKHGVGWASSEEYAAAFLGIPILAISIVLCLFAFFRLRSGKRTGAYTFVLLMSALYPAILIGKVVVTKSGESLYWKRKDRWLAIGWPDPRKVDILKV